MLFPLRLADSRQRVKWTRTLVCQTYTDDSLDGESYFLTPVSRYVGPDTSSEGTRFDRDTVGERTGLLDDCFG